MSLHPNAVDQPVTRISQLSTERKSYLHIHQHQHELCFH